MMLSDLLMDGFVKRLQSRNNDKLEDVIDSLRDKVEQLRSKKRRIEARLNLEESAYKKRTHKVTDWLYKAGSIGAEVDRAIVEAELELAERRTIRCYPWNRRSSSIVGLSVYDKLKAVNQLLTGDDFDVVVQRMPHPRIDVIPVEATVDFESNLDDVWRCLEDESLQIIGILGMAGVGKTTLLKKIKNDLEKGRLNTPVIWLSASQKTVAIEKEIAKQLAGFHKRWKRANETADGTRMFLLFLDGLWKRLDLSRILATRLNGSSYKVVFTTRSEEVCDDMAAGAKLRLNCLSDDQALKLFWRNAGDGIRDSVPQAQHLAGRVNKSLWQGLPLAIVAAGRAMVQMRNPSFEELPGIKQVFHILQPSYDNLDDDMVRRLFLYCSILPGKFRKDELIRLWMGEGFVDFSDTIRGEYFIKKLEQACLLESDEFSDCVGMHSVVRAFALFLSGEHVTPKNSILVPGWKSENLEEAVRLSMDGYIDEDTLPPSCPRLQTLFITIRYMPTISPKLFKSLRSVKVLDLSYNYKLYDLPSSIGILRNLNYLNVSHTNIKELPVEVGLLKELKVLLADFTEHWKWIREGIIGTISSLKVFSKLGGAIRYDKMLLKELERIEGIHEIGVSLFSLRAAWKLSDSPKLLNCIRKLEFKKIEGLHVHVSSLSSMMQLEDLVIEDCFDLQFQMDESRYHVLSIQLLRIRNCWEIDNLSWLIFTPGLRALDLSSCRSLVEVIGRDFKPEEIAEIDERLGIFSNLKWMDLEDLRSLECISPQVLRFPSLRDVYIYKCPQLSVLPFDENNVSIGSIRAYQRLETQLLGDEDVLPPGELSTREMDDLTSSAMLSPEGSLKKADVVRSGEKGSTKEKADVVASSEKGSTQEKVDVVAFSEKGPTQEEANIVASSKKGSTQEKADVVASSGKRSTQEKADVVASSEKGSIQEKADVVESSEKGPTQEEADIVASSEKGSTQEKVDVVASSGKGSTQEKADVVASSEKESTQEKADVVASSGKGSTQEKADVVASSEKGPTQEEVDVVASSEKGSTQEKADIVASSEKWSTQEKADIVASSGKGSTQEKTDIVASSEKGSTQEKADVVASSEKGSAKKKTNVPTSSARPSQEEYPTKGKETLSSPVWEPTQKKGGKAKLPFKINRYIKIFDDGSKGRKFGKRMVKNPNPSSGFHIY